MKRALLILGLLGLTGCAFAQKHPGVTIGIVTGTLVFGLCEINVEKLATCSVIGAGAGLTLGGITGLMTLIANTNAEETAAQEEQGRSVDGDPDAPPGLPPGFVPIDAGVPMTVDAGVVYAVDAATP